MSCFKVCPTRILLGKLYPIVTLIAVVTVYLKYSTLQTVERLAREAAETRIRNVVWKNISWYDLHHGGEKTNKPVYEQYIDLLKIHSFTNNLYIQTYLHFFFITTFIFILICETHGIILSLI